MIGIAIANTVPEFISINNQGDLNDCTKSQKSNKSC
jgi:hypothetical protein